MFSLLFSYIFILSYFSLTAPTPSIDLLPSGPIQGAMVGSPQVINCTVSTVSGVESNLVMIRWIGPGGNIDATNGRISIGSVTDDGNNTYTRSLQFTNLRGEMRVHIIVM